MSYGNCNSCQRSSCSGCGPRPDCSPCNDTCVRVGYVPGSACTLSFTLNGCTTTLSLAEAIKNCETDTSLHFDPTTGELIYNSERSKYTLSLCQMLESVKLECLGDVEVDNLKSCDIMVYDPYCNSKCADCADNRAGKWTNYHIPDAGDCVADQTEDGYYKVLTKNECGCIVECKVPIVPEASSIVSYIRDSVPDDPDFPWYYGNYNENKIALHLQESAPEYFGKYDLEVRIEYGVQAVRPSKGVNTNFRSLVIPYADGEEPNWEHNSYALQQGLTVNTGEGANPKIPWGSISMRGSITYIAPKGKELFLRHEVRHRTNESFPGYQTNERDGQMVPVNLTTAADKMEWNASRLNALHITIRPARGATRNKSNITPAPAKMDAMEDIAPMFNQAV